MRMNTSISIDANLYQFASYYAKQHKVSVRNLIETYLTSLRDKSGIVDVPGMKGSSNTLSFDKLRPELQEILTISAPMKGQLPEWDLDGDMAREEALNTL